MVQPTSQVRITCPLCKKPIAIDPTQSGMKFSCPHCSQRIEAPTLAKPEPAHPAATQKTMLADVEEMKPSELPQGPPPAPRWFWAWFKKEGWAAIGIPAGMAIIALSAGLFIFLTRGSSRVIASSVLTEYEHNKIQADLKYRGKVWTVSGTVLLSVITTRPGETMVGLIDRGAAGSDLFIFAFFQGQDGKILSLKSGDPIVFSGTCIGDNRKGGIKFEGCQLESR